MLVVSIKSKDAVVETPAFDIPKWNDGDWLPYLPPGPKFAGGFRSTQKQILPIIKAAFDSGAKNVLLNAPTGIGKSNIGYAIGRMNEPFYIAVKKKGLQEQYRRDFDDLKVLMGRNEFSCNIGGSDGCSLCRPGKECFPKNRDFFFVCTADVAPCVRFRRVKSFFCPYKGKMSDPEGSLLIPNVCGYYKQVYEALLAPGVVTNRAYLYVAGNFAGTFKPRTLLIDDEVHTTESDLMGMLETKFSDERIQEFLPSFCMPLAPMPKGNDWSVEHFALQVALEELKDQLKEIYDRKDIARKLEENDFPNDKELRYAERLAELIEKTKKHLRLFEDWRKWVWFQADFETTFKPLDVKAWAESVYYNFGEQRRLLMSATIPDGPTLARNLGLKDEESVFINVEYSPFPVVNRPILFEPNHGVMRNANDEWRLSLQSIAIRIDRILREHPTEKGVIFSHAGRYEEALVGANGAEPMLADESLARVVRAEGDGKEKRKAIDRFKTDLLTPSVLMSTYISEGESFDDDIARFGVIIKVPWPSLGDVQVQKRAAVDDAWYTNETVTKIVQQAGRVVRSETDRGTIYILDGGFRQFYSRNRRLFPHYFKEAVKGA